MNEQLQNLARRAGFIGTNLSNTVIGTDQETALANFAELIVQECAQVGEDTDGNWNVKHNILKHFGVK